YMDDFDALQNISEIPDDLKKKFQHIKNTLEDFKKKVLKEHKEIIGISLLPPNKPLTGAMPGMPNVLGMPGMPAMPAMPEMPNIPSGKSQDEDKEAINVFVLVDDSNVERGKLIDFIEKIDKNVVKIAKEVDSKIKTTTLATMELKEQCYDGKYDLLRMISIGITVYDPKELLAAVRIAEVHKSMVIRKFDKYIVSYVAAGSLFRGDQISNDIDVYVIVDDTDVKRMGRFELKDKLRSIIIGQGFEASRITGVKKQFHIQTYILTDFWESMKDANPVIFTLLRDGVPLYDRGVFMPWKLLLEMGRVKPSPEAIDVQMDIGDKLLVRTKQKLLSVVGEDLYYAMLNPAQAALMMYGLNPPTPKETIHLLREVFVKKEKLLEEKYVKSLEEIRKYYKDIEHGKVKEVSGAEIDRLLKGAQGYLDKLNSIFNNLEKKMDKKSFGEMNEQITKLGKDILIEFNSKEKDLKKGLKKLVDNNELSKMAYEGFLHLMNVNIGKMERAEAQKARREARTLINQLNEVLQVKRTGKMAKNRIKIHYSGRFGEVYLFPGRVFIVVDVNASEKEVQKAELLKDGQLKGIQGSTMIELEDALLTNPNSAMSMPGKLMNELKKIFGQDFEIGFN
ncbi:MAG TPA: hypothetical protein VJJ21_01240, partial [Candidatus Nanoarchaeia archaeon]|nr:hypothetical protein [Candidatus Nanoarchaeia archaeon]